MSALAPITGRFKRRVVFDLVGSVTIGTGLAYLFWYSHVVPKFEGWRKFDAEVKAKAIAEEAEWMKETNYKRG
ncbi:hypothetical protein BC833DRAFT_596038 [Globomyces pollinis-pini]|nr:hypothetical protein BC833DRAFT_596038 [Globomyces pollinis-pini]